MNAWTIWSLIVAGLGVLFVGIYIGEKTKVIEDRRNNRVRMINGADTNWFFVGIVLIGLSIALAVIGHNPPEKLKANADQIRSSSTTTDNR